jgi:hypothetical protein
MGTDPVTDRGSYIDKAVDTAAGGAKTTAPKPAPPPPPPPPTKSKVEQDADDAIYGAGAHSSGQASNAGSQAQSTDSYNKY